MEESISKVKHLALKQDELLEKYKAQNIKDQLRIAAASLETQAEATARGFVDNKMPVEVFLKKFLAERTVRP